LIISHDDEKTNRRQNQDAEAEKDLHPSHLIAKNGNRFAFLPRSGDYRSDFIMAAFSFPISRSIASLLSYLRWHIDTPRQFRLARAIRFPAIRAALA
jgi:hypothetical protein